MSSASKPSSPFRHRVIRCEVVWRALEGDAGLIDKLLSSHKEAVDERADKPLRCIACGNAITHERERISVQGMHEHDCTNPHGYRFRIGCFRQAPGGAEIDEQTYEHTWFAGYAWRMLLCAKCGIHLGWGFHASNADRFFGLILDRLIRPH